MAVVSQQFPYDHIKTAVLRPHLYLGQANPVHLKHRRHDSISEVPVCRPSGLFSAYEQERTKEFKGYEVLTSCEIVTSRREHRGREAVTGYLRNGARRESRGALEV